MEDGGWQRAGVLWHLNHNKVWESQTVNYMHISFNYESLTKTDASSHQRKSIKTIISLSPILARIIFWSERIFHSQNKCTHECFTQRPGIIVWTFTRCWKDFLTMQKQTRLPAVSCPHPVWLSSLSATMHDNKSLILHPHTNSGSNLADW